MHPAQLLSDPRRPYVPQGTNTDPAPASDRIAPLSVSSPSPFLPFDPPEQVTRKLLRQFVDPTLSLTTIADTHNTDLDSLCAWMAREDIRQRFHNFRSACAERTRAAAENCLSMVVQTAHAVIHEFHDDQHHMNFKPQDPSGHEIKRRNRETAMRAGRLLLRLARYYSLDLTRAATPTPGTPTLPGGSSALGTPNLRVGSSSSHSATPPAGTPPLGTPTLRGGSPTSEIVLALLDNPTLAAQLTQAIAAQQATAPNSDAGAAPPTSAIPNPKSDIASAPATPPNQTSQARPSGRNTLSPGRQPRETVAPIPKPAERAKQARRTNPRETPVPLTISARSLTTAAGAPHARAP